MSLCARFQMPKRVCVDVSCVGVRVQLRVVVRVCALASFRVYARACVCMHSVVSVRSDVVGFGVFKFI